MRLRRTAVVAAFALCAGGCASLAQFAAAAAAAAATADRVEMVAPGVIVKYVTDPSGPFVLRVVTIDLRNSDYELRQVRARDSLAGREKLSSMVARQRGGASNVIVAINADFFNLQTGESESNVVIDGEWWKGVRGTTSPYDAWDNAHVQFGVSATGKPLIDRFVFHGVAIRGQYTFPITSLNHFARGGSEATVLFTPRFGRTPIDTSRVRSELPLRRVAARGDTVLFVQYGAKLLTTGNVIPAGGAILAAYGPRATILGNFSVGDTIRILLRAAGNRGDGPLLSPRAILGGWPRILRDGQNVAADAPWSEATVSSNAEVRHPRSAVGFNRDTTKLFLVTVDGRQTASVGMTLVELADFMKKEGVWDAMNFDGGGSTTLIVKGAIVNHPSDAVGEREIANALLLVRRTR